MCDYKITIEVNNWEFSCDYVNFNGDYIDFSQLDEDCRIYDNSTTYVIDSIDHIKKKVRLILVDLW